MIRYTLLAAPLALAAFAVPAAAQDDMMMQDMSTLTCADLMAMDSDGMMATSNQVDMMMQMESMSEEDRMAMQENMSGDMDAMSDAEKQTAMMSAMMEDHQMKMDAMSEDEKTEAMAMSETHMQALETACEGNDDMLVQEAAKAAM